ncbi:MAG: type II toxin-antitoxin system HigB family toxin [Chloroherpetonaceae bacterium]
MVIIKKKTLDDFAKRHADALLPLKAWYQTTVAANWRSFADVKKDFPSTDYVGNERYVFNIKGNAYRLVVLIRFSIRTVFIKFIGTHAEYDQIDATTVNDF